MDWINNVQKAINYIEENLLEELDVESVSRHVSFSRDYFLKMFNMVTGFTVGEYIRNRRLSLAGQEVTRTKAKIIDIALKYRYETPESFTKAFSRFYGLTPSEARTCRVNLKMFFPLTIQINLKGGFNMNKILDVRSVGWLQNLKDDTRSPESFAFPACMTSLMEHIGENAGWITIQAHGREWTKRTLYNDLLAATGMSFGLLWDKENCPSCMDLTQVNDHDHTIGLAFDYMGYDYEIVERTDANQDQMKRMIVESIDSGRSVLAFGIIGPPECGIICGYDCDGDTLFGWSHFQSYEPGDCSENGMFRKTEWHKDVWKIVLCKDKRPRNDDLKDIIRRGCAIMRATKSNQATPHDHWYYAGSAAYDAWEKYIDDSTYDSADDDELRKRYWLHHAFVGNHAEARCYLGGMLENSADTNLSEASKCFLKIHDMCWKIWGVAGGLNAQDGYKCLRDKIKRDKITKLIREIQELDQLAYDELNIWLDR